MLLTFSVWFLCSKYTIPVAARSGAGSTSDSKPNAFAHVSFAGLTGKTDKKHTALPKTPAPPSFVHHASPPPVMNTFASSTGIPTPAPPPRTNTSTVAPESTADLLSELNSSFHTHVMSLPVNGGDWESCMLQYQAYYDGVVADDANDASGSGAATMNNGTTSTTTSTSPATGAASNNTTVSFAIPAAASTPSPAAGVTSPALFASTPFPSAPKPSPSTSTATASPANDDTSDTSPTPISNNPSKFYETRAKCLRSINGEWVSNMAGTLSLESDAQGKRLVIRSVAHILLLCPLPTEITKEEQKNSKGETKRFIQFYTTEDGREDPLLVRIQTKPQELDTLYEKIRELGDQ